MKRERIEPTDESVYAFANDNDCSLIVARETLRAELNTPEGQDVNYQSEEWQ